jgi:hypothetical protein
MFLYILIRGKNSQVFPADRDVYAWPEKRKHLIERVPKLKPVHLKPNSFQRMNVKLAVRVRNACLSLYFAISYYCY